MTPKQFMLGALAIFITAASIYIIMPDADVKMRIDNDKSTFYVHDGRWLISGEHYNKLFNGSKLVYRRASNVNVEYDFDHNTNSTIITRTTPYYSGAMIVDTFAFNGLETDITNFPVSHTVEIHNAAGLIYQYEVRRLAYSGETVWDVASPQSFGRNMKVSFSDGYYYSKIYKYANKDEGKLTVKYRIEEDYVKLDMRLYDPPVDLPKPAVADRAHINNLRSIDVVRSANKKSGTDRRYKSYSAQSKSILIEDDAYIPLIKIRLTSDYMVTGLIAGDDTKVAEFYLEDFKHGKTNLVDVIDFYDVKNDYEPADRAYWFKYGLEKKECFSGSGECQDYIEWIRFDTLNELPHKNIAIGLFTNTEVMETIEWVPIIAGFEILQWAAWDVTSASYLQLFSVANEDSSPHSLFFKPDGTKMYVLGSSGDDVNEYDLSDAWNVTSASFLQLFSIATKEGSPKGLFFKSDGTKMYVIGSSSDNVNEYDLSAAWDVTSASFLQLFSVASEDTTPTDLFFKSDGLKMYVLGSSGDDVNEYDLSDAWNVTSASYLQLFSVASEEAIPTGISFKSDGTKMYVTGTVGDDVNEYDLPVDASPTYSDNSTNTTYRGQHILHSLKWTDDTGLATTGGYIFSFDNGTGTFTNDSWSAFSANPDWTTVTKSVNNTIGTTIQWKVYANDTSDNWNTSSTYSYVTTVTNPTFNTLIEAGNPGESVFGTDTSSHYYRNGTRQTESWINITVDISHIGGDVFVEWKNETDWKNYTMTSSGDTHTINISSQPEYGNYTFNIWASNSVDMINVYNWTFYDYEAGWGDKEDWRKYVGLSAATESFSYEQFYLHETSYSSDQLNDRALLHEQPTDGTLHDTGAARYDIPAASQERNCTLFTAYSIDNTIKMNATIIENIYYHIFWETNFEDMSLAYEKENDSQTSWDSDELMYFNTSTSKLNVSLPGFNHSEYHLSSGLWNISNHSFSDNDINLFTLKFVQVDSGGHPSVISFINNTNEYISFFILNIPDNTTLNNTDTDSDGLSDYYELFEHWTDPKESDTDGGGEDDNSEVINGRNPLDGSDDVTSDSTAPTYSDNSTNSTVAGHDILHSLEWTDDTGLATTGGYIFSFDNGTGTFTNDSWSAFSANPDWTTVTKSVNNTIGTTIQWKVYANDTYDNWATSSTYSYLTTSDVSLIEITLESPSDSGCTSDYPYVIHNFTVDCGSDGCLNCSIWTDESGTWQMQQANQSTIINGSTNSINVTYTQGDGSSIWNAQCCNSTDCVMDSSNRTLYIDTVASHFTEWNDNVTAQGLPSAVTGDSILFYANCSCGAVCDCPMDTAYLQTNETGSYTDSAFNSTFVSWTNFTWSNASFSGDLGWIIYLNDTAGNLNDTGVSILTITSTSYQSATITLDFPFTNITKIEWNSTAGLNYSTSTEFDLNALGFTGTLQYICIERYCNNVSQGNWSVVGNILTYYAQKEINASQNMSLLLINGSIDDTNPSFPTGTPGTAPYIAGMAASLLVLYYYRRRR